VTDDECEAGFHALRNAEVVAGAERYERNGPGRRQLVERT